MIVAGIRVVVPALNINLRLPVDAVGKPAAEVVSACADCIGRQSLRGVNQGIDARSTCDTPQFIPRLTHRALGQELAARFHGTLIPAPASDRIHSQPALERVTVHKVQRGRLQTPGRVRQALIRLHAVLESEVIVHVLGLHSEIAVEIHSSAHYSVIGLPRELAHVPERASEPSPNVEVEAVESLRRGSRDSKPAQGKQEQYSLTQSGSPVS